MHPADIICALAKAGYTQTRLATRAGLTNRSTVSNVIYGRHISYNVASIIAEVTNIPLNKLWPDGRYSQPARRNRKAA